MDQILLIIEQVKVYLPAIAGIVASCAALAVITPTKVDDKVCGNLGKVINVLLRLINVAGLNFGNAVNRDDA